MNKVYVSVILRPVDKYALLTKREDKMTGDWPSWSINSQKKERNQYPAILTEQAWSIKDLLYGKRTFFSCGTQRVIPSGQDSAVSPPRVANHRSGFVSSCPLTELAIQSVFLFPRESSTRGNTGDAHNTVQGTNHVY